VHGASVSVSIEAGTIPEIDAAAPA
jgi:hypothetical protein